MNSFITIIKVFLLVNTVNFIDSPKDIGLRDFVAKKQSIYSPTQRLSIPKQDQHLLNSGSIMQPVSIKQELAIFCKMEHELMKASGFAVKFRLGDQSFVDQLEGK